MAATLGSVVATDHGDGVAAVYRPVGQEPSRLRVDRYFETVLGEAHIEAKREARRQLTALVGPGHQYDAGTDFAAQGIQSGQVQIDLVVGQQRMIDGIHCIGPVADRLPGRHVQRVSQQADGEFFAQSVRQPPAGRQQLARHGRQLSSGSLTEHQDSSAVSHQGLPDRRGYLLRI